MSCSIISDTVKVMVKDNGRHNTGQAAEKLFGSALQNPDMSRVKLASLLRRQKEAPSLRTGRTFWDSFLMQQSTAHANTNDLAS